MDAIRSLYVVIQLKDQLTDQLQRVNKAVDSVKSGIRGLSETIQQYSWAVAGAGAALTGFAYGGFRFFSEATKEFANYQDAMRIFRAYVGENADAIIKAMEEAAEGTISSTQMILNANKAIVMGIDTEYLPKMMKIARAAARAMGTDVNYMFESIAVGVARQSKFLLDNLGIIVDADAAYEQYAKRIGKTASQLTEAEKRQAFLNAAIEAGNRLVDKADLTHETLNEQLAKSRVAWSEFKKALAEGALPVISAFTSRLEGLTKWLKDLPKPILTIIGTLGVLATASSAVIGPLLLQAAALAFLRVQLLQLGGVTGVIAGLKAAMLGFAGSMWAAIAPLLPIIAVIGAVVGAILLLQDVLVKGWEKSYLGQFVNWLLEKLPFLRPIAQMVAISIQALRIGFDWFSRAISNAIERIRNAIESSGILKFIVTMISLSIIALQTAFDWLKSAFTSFIKTIAENPIIATIYTMLSTSFRALKSVFDWFKSAFTSFIGGIIMRVEEFVRWITDISKAIAENPVVRVIGGALKVTTITEHRLPTLSEIAPKPAQMTSVSRIENKQVNAPISINIQGVRDPDKVAEVVEKRLERQFNRLGIY